LRDSAVGRAIIFPEDNGFLLNQNLVKITPNQNNDGRFIYTQLLRERYAKYIENIERGNANQANIAISDLWKYVLKCPISKKEQTKIGNYFQQLDTLIAQHQQKHDKLLNLKKALLEKMFPKQGAPEPEIRFKGFSGDWEDKALGVIADVRDGTHTSPQYYVDGYPFVTSKNVKNGYINYEDVQFISKYDFDEINKRSKVDINDILMGMIGTIGNIALIRKIADFAIKNVALIKDKKLANYLYVYYFLQTPIALKQLEDGVDGGTQKFISLSNVRNLFISLPDKIEQTKIGNYFEQLDTLISQHQIQLKKLGNIKQACLEKMFV
jgi:type I restriction enzyme S subunit